MYYPVQTQFSLKQKGWLLSERKRLKCLHVSEISVSYYCAVKKLSSRSASRKRAQHPLTLADPALPHTDFPNTGHVKPLSPSYFVDFGCLSGSNGLIDKTLAAVARFSRALAISVFDSAWMYSFCGALTSLFYVLLVTFYFLLVFYCSLCSSLIFT